MNKRGEKQKKEKHARISETALFIKLIKLIIMNKRGES